LLIRFQLWLAITDLKALPGLQSLGYTDVSSLASYLLLAYSAGILITTPLAAFFFHRYPYRRSPLLGGLFVLTLGIILLLLARPFWCMVIARLLQGIASAVVWNVGMAMICDNVDDNVVGRQLGYAMSGLAVGTSIGPVIGEFCLAGSRWRT
jgi:DHA1 family vesicular acetylcholine transporter-like MFS transporter 3